MTRLILKGLVWTTRSACLSAACLLAQSSSAGSLAQSADASATRATPQATSAQPAEAKKPKKVWTNDDLASTGGQPASAKKAKDALAGSSARGGAPDAQYIANTKKQLEKLQGQLTDTEQQLSDLRDFQAGKPPASTGGYEINKGYNRMPVDQQISHLENKRTQIQQKIDDLLDEAHKKGVEPGQLR
jgi:hypothetical protein